MQDLPDNHFGERSIPALIFLINKYFCLLLQIKKTVKTIFCLPDIFFCTHTMSMFIWEAGQSLQIQQKKYIHCILTLSHGPETLLSKITKVPILAVFFKGWRNSLKYNPLFWRGVWHNCVWRRRTLPNRHVTAGCYVNSRFSVYVAFASLSCGDLVERTHVCGGITVHSAASDRL